jgi:predicted 3-demethylubiquinone-9 3-methyltransferase (glyoxalase superfamily)
LCDTEIALLAFTIHDDSKPVTSRHPVKKESSPFLWFDYEAEEAANFYVGIFENSRINEISVYPEAGQVLHGRPPGSVMVVDFELDGETFRALNGGPIVKVEAISLEVECETQEELDYYWERLSDGGDPDAQQCGWLKDRYGVTWQVVPTILPALITDNDVGKSTRVMQAMLKMKKLDIAELKKAADGH